MKRDAIAKRGAVLSSLTAFAVGFVCLACVLPGIGAIIGISFLVTAAGGIADDAVLTVVGVVALIVSLALGAFVLNARRRDRQACAVAGLEPAIAAEPHDTTVATRDAGLTEQARATATKER